MLLFHFLLDPNLEPESYPKELESESCGSGSMQDTNPALEESGSGSSSTELVLRMAHRKEKETKQEPGTAEPGNMLGCCLDSFHFLWAILSTSTVDPDPPTDSNPLQKINYLALF